MAYKLYLKSIDVWHWEEYTERVEDAVERKPVTPSVYQSQGLKG